MQKIIDRSKFTLLAVVSSFLIFVCNGAGTFFPEIIPTHNVSSANLIWSSISDDFKLDHMAQTSSRVKAEIRKLLADQDKLYQILEAAGPYIYYIHNEIKARGLPAELALIPVIESEFNPNDHSKKGASGLWQLMPQTAVELGVKVKSNYDGRRNVVSSTKAALAYFNDLGNMFNGDWYLAIAAYNCGQGKVFHAQRHNDSRDYWNLKLPNETKLYVPKLLAVAEIIKNPQKYGVQLPPINNKPYFTEFKMTAPVSLNQVSKSTGIDIETLNALNPDYKRHDSVKVKGFYSLLVPVETAPLVKIKFAPNIVV